MTTVPIQMIVTRHRHLPRDLSEGAAQLWGFRLALILPIVYLCERSSTAFGYMLAITFVVGTMLLEATLRRVMRTSGTTTSPATRFTTVADANARLCCYGEDAELESLMAVGGECFEPVIVRGYIVSRACVEWTMIIAGLATLVITTAFMHLGDFAAALLTVGSGVLVSVLFYGWQSYYRIVPGKLEILRSSLVGSGVRVHRCIDLYEARIVCRYDTRSVRIVGSTPCEDSPGASDSNTDECLVITIDLSALLQPHAFCEALFRGANCVCPTPKLPQNQLVG